MNIKKKILPIGDVLKTDKNGFIIKKASLEKIKNPWKRAIDFLVEKYVEYFGDKIHSIYLRGSVPMGTSIEGVSDIDSFILINEKIDKEKINKIREMFFEKFKFVKKLECQVLDLNEVLNFGNFFWWRFAIKTQSVCVYGENISDKISGFKINKGLYNKIKYNLSRDINQAKDKIGKNKDDGDFVKEVCTWIMKRVLRQAFLIVMEKENVFTRDLYFCNKIFLKYFPSRKEDAEMTLELSIYPTSNIKKINGILDNFGLWIIEKSKEI